VSVLRVTRETNARTHQIPVKMSVAKMVVAVQVEAVPVWVLLQETAAKSIPALLIPVRMVAAVQQGAAHAQVASRETTVRQEVELSLQLPGHMAHLLLLAVDSSSTGSAAVHRLLVALSNQVPSIRAVSTSLMTELTA